MAMSPAVLKRAAADALAQLAEDDATAGISEKLVMRKLRVLKMMRRRPIFSYPQV
jgi:hypothetical protein